MPFVMFDDARIYYREEGTYAERTVLFLHGFPLDHTLWDGQFRDRPADLNYIAMDLRGFGQSASRHSEGPLRMSVHAGDVATLLDRLGVQSAGIVALSMGGYVALALYEARPDLFDSLVLMDTRAGADGEEARAGRDASAARLVREGRQVWGQGLMEALLGPDAGSMAKARLLEMIESTSYPTIVSALEGMRVRADRTHLLADIGVPTLVMVGADDALTPPATAAAMAEAIPRGRLVEIPGAGHLPPIEAPDAVNAALAEFLGTG